MGLLVDDAELRDLVGHYESEADDVTEARWRRLLDAEAVGPLALVNAFVFRERAAYPDGRAVSGPEAFATYAAVSAPALARVGGRFLASGPPVADLFGVPAGDDLIVVGWYPDRAALLALLRDPEYREAFGHRRAALAVDRVVAVNALPL